MSSKVNIVFQLDYKVMAIGQVTPTISDSPSGLDFRYVRQQVLFLGHRQLQLFE